MIANAPFRLLVITPEGSYQQETQWVSRLFNKGLDTLHLRKPGWDIGQLLTYLHRLDACWYPQIMVHYQADIRDYLPVKGVHFQQHTLPKVKPSYAISCPVHAWQEFTALETLVDYALVSPFFNSISKKGYAAKPALQEIPAQVRRQKAVALGGIDSSNIAEVQKQGLGGAAVLGAVWQTADPLVAYLNIHKKLNHG